MDYGKNSRSLSFSQAVKISVTRFALGKKTNDIKWGDRRILEGRDFTKLTRAHLKRHLSARNENLKGSRPALIKRLEESLERERQIELKRAAEAEAKHRKIADLEEQGAVYSCGSNHRGQLGLGDLEKRNKFTVIPETRGLGIQFVTCRNDIIFAVSKKKETYCWGGGGVGPMGMDSRSERAKFESPQIVQHLVDEDILKVAVGSNHACAVSECGDVYCWGEGRNGCLGNGQSENQIIPDLVPTFTEKIHVKEIRAGEMHTCALSDEGEIHSFGHKANGRLGLGYFDKTTLIDFSIPHMIHFPFNQQIRMVACGSEHSIAVGQRRQVFSWGLGDGGRLGHGDYSDRWEPTAISALNGETIVNVSCGTWHSACIVAVPPMKKDRGWLYTFGSGINGQLGQGDNTTSTKPSLVPFFCDNHILLKKIICGSHHNAAITSHNELYTWGSNLDNCLGHEINEQFVPFTPTPGYCAGFGAIVNRIGRGFPQSITLGRGFTIVATHKYFGPTEAECKQTMKAFNEELKRKQESSEMKAMNKFKKVADAKKKKGKLDEIQFLTSVRACTVCDCPGKFEIFLVSIILNGRGLNDIVYFAGMETWMEQAFRFMHQSLVFVESVDILQFIIQLNKRKLPRRIVIQHD